MMQRAIHSWRKPSNLSLRDRIARAGNSITINALLLQADSLHRAGKMTERTWRQCLKAAGRQNEIQYRNQAVMSADGAGATAPAPDATSPNPQRIDTQRSVERSPAARPPQEPLAASRAA